MPESQQVEEPISGSGEKPVDPARFVFTSRKWLLLLVMYTLGLPVFFAVLAPPAAGSWILWHQYALYREQGRWHEFSLYGLATLTLDGNLAERLAWPGLAACEGYQSVVLGTEPSNAGPSESASRDCPQLGPWQSWLLHPTSYPVWHMRVERLFRSIPVSSVFFLIGLMLSFVLQFFGMDWRFRPRPAPPAPPVSSSAIRELTPKSPDSGDSDSSA